MTFWHKLEQFPPIRCRLLARSGPRGAALSNEEVASRAGLSVYQVAALSQQLDWSGVEIATARAFSEACGVDFHNAKSMKRVTVYSRGKVRNGAVIPPSFQFLRRSPHWKDTFKPLAERWMRAAKRGV